MGPIAGMARIYFDGSYIGSIDLYRARYTRTSLEKTGLPLATHTVRIEVSDDRNPRSLGYFVDIDALEVLP